MASTAPVHKPAADRLDVPRCTLVEVIELLDEARLLRDNGRYEARDLERRARCHLERLLDGASPGNWPTDRLQC